MPIMPYQGRLPVLPVRGYIAPTAAIIGDVTLGEDASVWFGAVLRGDVAPITVGPRSNVQDNCVLHGEADTPTILGADCTLGHGAIVHACTVGDEVLIGMGATILDGAVIGDRSLIGANALVTQKTEIPAGSLVLGSPAKVVRSLTAAEQEGLKVSAQKYAENAAFCLEQGINPQTAPESDAP